MKFSVSDLSQQLSEKKGTVFLEFFRKNNLSFEIYKPDKIDLQKPHQQDELYLITSGEGMFQDGDEQYPVSIGDLIFVPALKEHRFYEFTDDFSTWVIFV
jgi:mannose-6-phosphate isomerase-like protein (cupin superfamily)